MDGETVERQRSHESHESVCEGNDQMRKPCKERESEAEDVEEVETYSENTIVTRLIVTMSHAWPFLMGAAAYALAIAAAYLNFKRSLPYLVVVAIVTLYRLLTYPHFWEYVPNVNVNISFEGKAKYGVYAIFAGVILLIMFFLSRSMYEDISRLQGLLGFFLIPASCLLFSHRRYEVEKEREREREGKERKERKREKERERIFGKRCLVSTNLEDDPSS
jgi:hypothetical protein